MSRRERYSSPSSPEWSPDTEAAIREKWPDSLSTSLSPYLFPPTATPPRPGVPNLRAQQPRPEQNRFFPQNDQQNPYSNQRGQQNPYSNQRGQQNRFGPQNSQQNPFIPEHGQQNPFSPPIPPGRYSPQQPTLRRVFTSEEDLRQQPAMRQEYIPRPPPSPPGPTIFPSRNVVPVTSENFKQKIEPMAKGLVYFYNSRGNRHSGTEERFLEAADTLHHELFMFAAVDCGIERDVCNYYQITETPTIKLFSNGHDVSTIHRPESFSVDALQKFITWAPVLQKNRAEEGRDFLEQSAQKKQRDHYYKQQSEYYR